MKSSQTTKPAKFAKPYITGAADTLKNTYSQNAGTIQDMTNGLTGMYDTMLSNYQAGDPTLTAAKSYNTDVLSGKYLDAGNPYLTQMIAQSNDDIRNQTQAAMGLKGLTGGSDYAGLIADRIGQNTLAMRYQDYASERDRMANASAQAGSLISADNARMQPLLSTLSASTLPLEASGAYSGNIAGLLSPYTKTSQKGSVGGMLAGLAGTGLSAWAGGGFKGL